MTKKVKIVLGVGVGILAAAGAIQAPILFSMSNSKEKEIQHINEKIVENNDKEVYKSVKKFFAEKGIRFEMRGVSSVPSNKIVAAISDNESGGGFAGLLKNISDHRTIIKVNMWNDLMKSENKDYELYKSNPSMVIESIKRINDYLEIISTFKQETYPNPENGGTKILTFDGLDDILPNLKMYITGYASPQTLTGLSKEGDGKITFDYNGKSFEEFIDEYKKDFILDPSFSIEDYITQTLHDNQDKIIVFGENSFKDYKFKKGFSLPDNKWLETEDYNKYRNDISAFEKKDINDSNKLMRWFDTLILVNSKYHKFIDEIARNEFNHSGIFGSSGDVDPAEIHGFLNTVKSQKTGEGEFGRWIGEIMNVEFKKTDAYKGFFKEWISYENNAFEGSNVSESVVGEIHKHII